MSEIPAAGATPEAPAIPEPVEAEPTAGEAELGDAGKKALDAMKAKWKAAEIAAQAAQAELAKRDAEIAAKDKPAEQIAIDAARLEGITTATAAANLKLANSALKLAAKGVLADPLDALAFIDATTFDVDDNGDVDSDALTEAIAELLVRKPHLAAGKPNPFGGSGDGGATPPPKPTASIPERAAAALAAGDVKASIALKTSQLKPL